MKYVAFYYKQTIGSGKYLHDTQREWPNQVKVMVDHKSLSESSLVYCQVISIKTEIDRLKLWGKTLAFVSWLHTIAEQCM